ncbi:basic leucine zipper and W2 domain-containing protein 1-like [Dendronephthya gigantea]|uniref:basic leucine zipper and W2 domain-containing protein 1-like n=1 Tax=Dendronephthya gigantea TaxID=151771 RepID=UPI00106A076E|nr:basic leucine zipper and W2 domain-containing protein 1-like [Dendronephthya gigantea]
MNQKNPKPTLGGQRIKTRKRDEKEKYDPLGFRDSVITGLEKTGSDFENVSAFLDNPGNKLNYHAYGEQLFEILFAGGLLAPGGSIILEGEKPKTSICIFEANEDTETLRSYVQMFQKLIRRFKYLQKSFDDVLDKIIVFMKGFTEEQRMKLATVYAMILGYSMTQGAFLAKLKNEHLVKEGLSLQFMTRLFQVWFKEKKDSSGIIANTLKKNEMDDKLLEFFPPNKRTNEQFEKHFVAAGLPKLVEIQKNQQHVGSKKEYQSQLSEMIDAKVPLKEIIANCNEQKEKNNLTEEQVIVLTWRAIMSSVEWNKKEDLVADQALRHLKVYSPLLAEFASNAASELSLMNKIQDYCYDNMNFMKVFQKIILLMYKTDVLSEDTVLKWYKTGHGFKGKSVFLEQMKKMVEWLQSAEEETDSEEDD